MVLTGRVELPIPKNYGLNVAALPVCLRKHGGERSSRNPGLIRTPTCFQQVPVRLPGSLSKQPPRNSRMPKRGCRLNLLGVSAMLGSRTLIPSLMRGRSTPCGAWHLRKTEVSIPRLLHPSLFRVSADAWPVCLPEEAGVGVEPTFHYGTGL
jgi:hypothetical protein